MPLAVVPPVNPAVVPLVNPAVVPLVNPAVALLVNPAVALLVNPAVAPPAALAVVPLVDPAVTAQCHTHRPSPAGAAGRASAQRKAGPRHRAGQAVRQAAPRRREGQRPGASGRSGGQAPLSRSRRCISYSCTIALA